MHVSAYQFFVDRAAALPPSRLEMIVGFSAHNPTDGCQANVVNSCQGHQGERASRMIGSQSEYAGLGQSGPWSPRQAFRVGTGVVLIPRWHSLALDHVAPISGSVVGVQVGRLATDRSVAGVANQGFIGGQRSVGQDVGDLRRVDCSALIPEVPVSIGAHLGNPVAASAFVSWSNLGPEAGFNRYREMCANTGAATEPLSDVGAGLPAVGTELRNATLLGHLDSIGRGVAERAVCSGAAPFACHNYTMMEPVSRCM